MASASRRRERDRDGDVQEAQGVREGSAGGMLESHRESPVGVKWVDMNKGDKEKPEYSCCLVAKEMKNDKRDDFLWRPCRWKRRKYCFRCSRACLSQGLFHTKAGRSVHVDLLKENHQEEARGRLKKAMHGARGAAQNWELEYT